MRENQMNDCLFLLAGLLYVLVDALKTEILTMFFSST